MGKVSQGHSSMPSMLNHSADSAPPPPVEYPPSSQMMSAPPPGHAHPNAAMMYPPYTPIPQRKYQDNVQCSSHWIMKFFQLCVKYVIWIYFCKNSCIQNRALMSVCLYTPLIYT